MDFIEASFMSTGKSPTVLALADQLTGELQHRRAIGDVCSPDTKPADANSVIVKLQLAHQDDTQAMTESEQWLKHHASILRSTDARKIIEFQTFLDSNTGSRILSVPHSFVQICADLGLDIANQAFRILSKSE